MKGKVLLLQLFSAARHHQSSKKKINSHELWPKLHHRVEVDLNFYIYDFLGS